MFLSGGKKVAVNAQDRLKGHPIEQGKAGNSTASAEIRLAGCWRYKAEN